RFSRDWSSDVCSSDLTWRRVVSAIEAADEVSLACHVSPDGDALGSMLALGLALRAAGRRVVASFGDRRFAVPRLLRFLPGQDLLVEPRSEERRVGKGGRAGWAADQC